MSDSDRAASHLRSIALEDTLRELERLLGGSDKTVKPREDLPVIFIMGSPRSGSTLLTQALAAATDWCYPTNLISRFYYAPYIGGLIQRLLFDHDPKGELAGGQSDTGDFSSALGKTKGPLSPHEFWYFWRRFFQFSPNADKVDRSLLTDSQKAGFVHGIRCIQQVFGKPLFLKGMLLNLDLDLLAELIPGSVFIHLERDTCTNADSLLQARYDFFDDDNKWYSLKPEEYSQLANLEPRKQVVGQVHYINKALHRQFEMLSEQRKAHLAYEDFCKDPRRALGCILSDLNIPVELKLNRLPKEGFHCRQVDPSDWAEALYAIQSNQ